MSSSSVDTVVVAVSRIPDVGFPRYGGGWTDEIGTALVDAVFSIRATYNSKTDGKGVFRRVKTFRSDFPEATDDLEALVSVGNEKLRAVQTSLLRARPS